jgi:hypothetical protein
MLANFSAVRGEEGIELTWLPGDARPVSGWRLLRGEAGRWRPVTDAPLPAAARAFTDRTAAPDSACTYLLVALHPFGQRTEIGPYAYSPGATGIARASLFPCRPNPVHDSTTISFALPTQRRARLCIYDLTGRCVRTLLNGQVPEQQGRVVWDGRDDGGRRVAGGVYLYRLDTDEGTRTRKLLLVR